MEQKFLTLKEIALRLKLPESTLRKYRDAYPQFIPTVGTGRDRCYRSDAVEVFNAIRRYRASEMLSWEGTAEHLATRFPIDASALPEDKTAPLAVPSAPPPPEPQGPSPLDIALEALQRMETSLHRHDFLINTIAAEIVKMKEMYKSFNDALGDLGTVRRTVLAQNNDLRTFDREQRAAIYSVLDRTAQLQSSVLYIQRIVEKQAGIQSHDKSEPQSAPPAPQQPDESRRLIELVKERNEEIIKLKTTNLRMLSEVESLRKQLIETTKEHKQGSASIEQPPMHSHDPQQPRPAATFSSGKFVFKGKKK